jgi:hypothetical protein
MSTFFDGLESRPSTHMSFLSFSSRQVSQAHRMLESSHKYVQQLKECLCTLRKGLVRLQSFSSVLNQLADAKEDFTTKVEKACETADQMILAIEKVVQEHVDRELKKAEKSLFKKWFIQSMNDAHRTAQEWIRNVTEEEITASGGDVNRFFQMVETIREGAVLQAGKNILLGSSFILF